MPEYVLLPAQGFPPLLFGMTRDAAREATRDLGRQSEDPDSLRVTNAEAALDLFAHFENDGEQLTAVTVWRPDNGATRVVLRLGGEDIDMFGSTADSVMDQLVRRGHAIDISDIYFPVCDDIAVGFNRDGGEDNVDEDADDGLGIRFNSVLLARPGYYGQ